jgi:hypothetical protein
MARMGAGVPVHAAQLSRERPLALGAAPHVEAAGSLVAAAASLPLSNEEGSEGTTGKPRAGKPRKKKEWFEEE